MQLPESIKIGPFGYKILYPYRFRESTGIDGQADHSLLEIRLAGNDQGGAIMPDIRVFHVLIHELLHACLHTIGMHDLAGNEEMVDGLASMLVQVLLDGKLAEYINPENISNA